MNRIFTVVIIFFGLFAVFFVGMTSITYDESTKFTEKIYLEAKENQSFDDFLAYQSFAYQRVDRQTDALFLIEVYHVVTAISHENYVHQIVIFSIPLNSIDYALSVNDASDQTAFIVKIDSDTIIFDSRTHPSYQQVALSYGYNDHQLGFIYQVVLFDASADYQISIHDYDNHLYYDETLAFSLFDIEDLDPEVFSMGWSTAEISERMDLTNKLVSGISLTIGIYLGLIIIGFGIYFTLKKVNRSKIK